MNIGLATTVLNIDCAVNQKSDTKPGLWQPCRLGSAFPRHLGVEKVRVEKNLNLKTHWNIVKES